MYVRPQNHRYPSGIRLPENYSGSAFRELSQGEEAQNAEDLTETEITASLDGEEQNTEAPALLPTMKNSSEPHPSPLLRGHGIGSEELLILALILLLADNAKDDELILFLALLFFIK